MKNRIALALMGLLSAISITQGRDDDSTSEAQSPSVVLVYSKDGGNSMSGLCHDEGQNTLCNLTEVKIIPPDTKSADEAERKLLQELKQGPDKAKKGVRQSSGRDEGACREDSSRSQSRTEEASLFRKDVGCG